MKLSQGRNIFYERERTREGQGEGGGGGGGGGDRIQETEKKMSL